ncbi:MAG: hypothetical protein WKF77_03790 [Planctomycetaceae bacterium]
MEPIAVGSPVCFVKDATDETQVFKREHVIPRDVAYWCWTKDVIRRYGQGTEKLTVLLIVAVGGCVNRRHGKLRISLTYPPTVSRAMWSLAAGMLASANQTDA